MTASDDLVLLRPDSEIPARDFGVDSDMLVPAFSQHSEYVPDRDDHRLAPEIQYPGNAAGRVRAGLEMDAGDDANHPAGFEGISAAACFESQIEHRGNGSIKNITVPAREIFNIQL